MHNAISSIGLLLIILFSWGISSNKRNINWRIILWGVGIQLSFAWLIFKVPQGTIFFQWINDAVVAILDVSHAGSHFLFGRLALSPGTSNAAGETSLGFILAFQALPTIIFFSALVSILYFFKILPFIISKFARFFSHVMRISGAESLAAASNIFVGVESTFIVRPYLASMTRSELFTMLTAGMSTVASNVLAIYVMSLRSVFPDIAGHLISASFLSIPAALIVSKIIIPESDRPVTMGINVIPEYQKEDTLFEAIINGAMAGVKVIVGIAALLIAVLGLVALLDLCLNKLGSIVSGVLRADVDLSLKSLLGYVFYPFIFFTGVPYEDVSVISQIVAERVILTEVVAYQDLASAIVNGLLHHPRSVVIASYALCGFSHIASLSIFIGGISGLVPQKTRVVSTLGVKLLIASTLACLMTACVAGIFYSDTTTSILFNS